MSFFKTTWLVLNVEKMNEKEFLYTIFFRDYGVLKVMKKKKTREKLIDTGYIIGCEIITKNDRKVHTIWNIKTLGHFSPENKNFLIIQSFLSLLSYLKKNLPEWSPHYEVFDIFPLLLEKKDFNFQHILLARLKITSLLGNLWDKHPDETCSKILKFTHLHHFKDILRLGKIPEESLNKLTSLLW